MSNLTPPYEAETKALREIYAAINRKDIPAAVQFFDPQIEWIEPPDYPEGGTTHGLADVRALHERSLATWAEGGCEPERFIFTGDKAIVIVHVHVRLNDNVEWIEGRLADVYTLRNGKIIQKRTFDEPEHALEWAGVEESDRD